MDFQKVFNTVPHNRLVRKVIAPGIKGTEATEEDTKWAE